MLIKKFLVMIRAKPVIRQGRIYTRKLFVSPRLFTSRYLGIMPPEKYMVNTTNIISPLLYGRLVFARGYAVSIVTSTPEAVPSTVRIMVFK